MMVLGFLACTLFAAAAQMPDIPKLDHDVEVPMDFDGEAIFLHGAINGKPASFFFDTGFAGTIIVSDQLNVGPKAGTMYLRDFLHSFPVPTVKINSVALGAMKFAPKDLEVPQQDLRLTESYGRHGDALLGLRLVDSYVFELNFAKKTMIFHPANKVDISQRKPDNVKTFLIDMLPFGNDEVNIEITHGKDRLALPFDTGNAFFLVTYKEFLKKFKLFTADEPNYGYFAGIASGVVPAFAYWAHDWKIAGIPVDHAVFDVHDFQTPGIEFGGTVGIKFIQNFNWIVDYRRRQVWAERVGSDKFVPPKAEFGIKESYYDEKRGRWRVYTVQKSSPADKAGMKKGDVLLDIDGIDLGKLTHKKLEDVLNGPAGSKAKVTISRMGNVMRFEMTRAYLINGDPPPGLKSP